MTPALMPSEAERQALGQLARRVGHALARKAADPFHEGWDALWEATQVLNRATFDTPDRERACYDRLMAVLSRCA
ncbi:hypothetical protein [Teichococcus vastitatis]|uniref:Uncharacterized protein n=1 Tax=Teichococcus vastitatis TaxID=2307076 RepID=A0ABS9W827_9PROT|nr:hypothetical protein [Pseudoroseomonas vastitatis]MCI0755452.1 hypothetical protein [Pseudoroseomonas vastitatis]